MGEVVLSICVGLCLVIAGVQVLQTAKRDEKLVQAFEDKSKIEEAA